MPNNYAYREEAPPAPGELARGNSTAFPFNVQYRLDSLGVNISGHWLDYGCADGGYAEAILAAGATSIAGIDTDPRRIAAADDRGLTGAYFADYDGHRIPFARGMFDGVFMNETLEHVSDEQETLSEIFRVLKPGGILAVISPNRWFPFECHTTRIGSHEWSPTPLIPWLPRRLTSKWVDARNYWPHEMRGLIAVNGFKVLKEGFIWPVFEVIPWAPTKLIPWYQRHLHLFSNLPFIRRFGVSNLVVARKAYR